MARETLAQATENGAPLPIDPQQLRSEIPSNMRTMGIFGSTSFQLEMNKSPASKEFLDKIRANYRSLSLVRPRIEIQVDDLLFVDNFVEYRSAGALLMQLLDRFYKLKQKELYCSCFSSPAQEQQAQTLDVSNVRLIIKLADLQRN